MLSVALFCVFGASCVANPSGDAAATVSQAIEIGDELIVLDGDEIEIGDELIVLDGDEIEIGDDEIVIAGESITPAQLAGLTTALDALDADLRESFEACEAIEAVLAACGITVPSEDASQPEAAPMACAAPADPDRVQLDAAILAAEATLVTAQADVTREQTLVDLGVGSAADLDVATLKVAEITAALSRLKVQRDQLLPAQQALKINPNDKAALLKLAEANEAIARLNLTAATAARWAAERARNREAELVNRGASTPAKLAQMEALYQEARQKEIAALLVVVNATAIRIEAAK